MSEDPVRAAASTDGGMEQVLKSLALEATADAMIITDTAGAIVWANQSFVDRSGYSRAEIIGARPRALITSGRQCAAFYQEMWDHLKSEQKWRGTLINRRKDGDEHPELVTITPIKADGETVSHYVAVMVDLSEQAEMQKALEALVSDKVSLLRELHHRVKNNMQVIVSLFNLSRSLVEDRQSQGVFTDVARKLRSMALVHELFYSSQDFAQIEFAEYVRQMVTELGVNNPEMVGRLLVTAEPDIQVGLEQAVTAGLIVSELAAGAVQDLMLRNQRDAAVCVDVTFRDDQIRVAVQPYPLSWLEEEPESPTPTRHSMAIFLIRALLQQLNGSLTVTNHTQRQVTLSFSERAQQSHPAL